MHDDVLTGLGLAALIVAVLALICMLIEGMFWLLWMLV